MANTIIVALDNMTEAAALAMAEQLAGEVWGFKVNDLLLFSGVPIISKLSAYGKVFADAKVHEIPNTTKNSVRRLAEAGASIITVHASGGSAMLAAAQEARGDALVCAVSVLTSLSDDECRAVYGTSAEETVLRLARSVVESGVEGLVCSPKELSLLKSDLQCANLVKVCPGVRPKWYGVPDDQNRTATPAQAIADGAKLLVVGRPITAADDPKSAAQRIQDEIA